VYDGWSLLEERNASGVEQARYYHGAMIDELLLRITANTYYYHHDGLGSTIALTDSTGALAESYTYDAFGAATILSTNSQALAVSALGNRFLFTGRECLAEIGLYDYRNRFYSPSLGRFLQTDPIGFRGMDNNIYRYVRNSPIMYIDPSGTIFEIIPILGALEMEWKTARKMFPGMKIEDYKEAAGNGEEPCCSENIRQQKATYLVIMVTPNIFRYAEDLIFGIIGVYPDIRARIIGVVGVVGGLLDWHATIDAMTQINAAAKQATDAYCKENDNGT
jgi:RHS repeat-associated protein